MVIGGNTLFKNSYKDLDLSFRTTIIFGVAVNTYMHLNKSYNNKSSQQAAKIFRKRLNGLPLPNITYLIIDRFLSKMHIIKEVKITKLVKLVFELYRIQSGFIIVKASILT